MSAEVLRKAAALMRERAEAPTAGPWVSWVEGRDHRGGDTIISAPESDIYITLDSASKTTTTAWVGTQDHMASWHPAVALAVADWLDMIARTHEPDETGEDWWANCPCDDLAHAVAVARAYLGGEA